MVTTIVEKPIVSDQTIRDYLVGSGTKLTDEQILLFGNIARSCNLDPFKREIYAIAYQNWKTGKPDISIVTGYQVYIDRATASGFLDGRNVEQLMSGDGKILGAKVVIHRKDRKNPFVRDVNIREFAKMTKEGKPMGMWSQMPGFMIKKVAIGQAFRLAFPNELGGLPYLQEEISSENEKPQEQKQETKQEFKIEKSRLDEEDIKFSSEKEVEKYLSEISGVEITKAEHGYSQKQYGAHLTREEQANYKALKETNFGDHGEILKKIKDPNYSPTDGDLPF